MVLGVHSLTGCSAGKLRYFNPAHYFMNSIKVDGGQTQALAGQLSQAGIRLPGMRLDHFPASGVRVPLSSEWICLQGFITGAGHTGTSLRFCPWYEMSHGLRVTDLGDRRDDGGPGP